LVEAAATTGAAWSGGANAASSTTNTALSTSSGAGTANAVTAATTASSDMYDYIFIKSRTLLAPLHFDLPACLPACFFRVLQKCLQKNEIRCFDEFG
jgi:hypothetical protein